MNTRKELMLLFLSLVLILSLISCGREEVKEENNHPEPKAVELYPIYDYGKEAYGYINLDGEVVIEPQFEQAENFVNGYALVILDSCASAIDETGKMLFEPLEKGTVLYNFGTNGLAVIYRDGKEGYINADGEIVIECKFDGADAFLDNGLALARIGDEIGFIDESGEFVVEPQFYTVGNFGDNGLAPYSNEKGLYGYVDKTGKIVIDAKYYWADPFKNGFARVFIDGKNVYIDENENIITDKKFDAAFPFADNGTALVMNADGLYGFIDKSGEYIIEPQFNKASSFTDNGLACIYALGPWGYIDKTGEFVIGPDAEFETAWSFADNGLALVRSGGLYGFIDKTGKFVIEPQFESALSFENGLAKIYKDSKEGYVNALGEIFILDSTEEQK